VIDNWEDLEQLTPLKKLETIYLERNPIWRDPEEKQKEDSNYRRKVKLLIPWLKQLDATYCR